MLKGSFSLILKEVLLIDWVAWRLLNVDLIMCHSLDLHVLQSLKENFIS